MPHVTSLLSLLSWNSLQTLNLLRVRIFNRDYWPFILLLCGFLFCWFWVILFLIYTLHFSSSIHKLAFICHPVLLFLKDEKLQFTHFGHAMTGSCLWELCLSLWGETCTSRRGVWKPWSSVTNSLPHMLSFSSVLEMLPQTWQQSTSVLVGRKIEYWRVPFSMKEKIKPNPRLNQSGSLRHANWSKMEHAESGKLVGWRNENPASGIFTIMKQIIFPC